MEIKCPICKKTFINNKGGQFTNHLVKEHELTLEQYTIEYEYNGNVPKCECGLCDDRPSFFRGAFKKYASGHREFKVRQELWIKKYGHPICNNPHCDNKVLFNRGKPNKYCSRSCSPSGFCDKEVQEKIKRVIKKRYGVDNISHLNEVKQKISFAKTGQKRKPFTEKHKELLKKSTSDRWKKSDYKRKTSKAIKCSINNDPEELNRRSKWMKDNYDFVTEAHEGNNRFSKLHLKIREYLRLDKLGFVREKKIGRYYVDELNEKYKLIIEINGDYIHANPKHHKPDDVIRLRGNSYKAREKWESDKIKLDNLKKMCYNVITIWESDELDEKLSQILAIIEKEQKSI